MQIHFISSPYAKYYLAPMFSQAQCFCLINYLIIIILPFLFFFSSKDFWQNSGQYLEQPQILYKQEMIVHCQGKSANYFYSNVQGYESIAENTMISPQISAYTEDTDGDGINDKLKGRIKFISDADKISNIGIIIPLTTKLSKRIRTDFESFIYLSINSPLGLSKAQLNGQIILQQKSAIYGGGFVRDRYNVSIFEAYGSTDYNIRKMIEQNQQYRNESLWAQYETITYPGNGQSETEINFDIFFAYNIVLFRYIPSIGESLKLQWPKYLALFIPLWAILRLVMNFAYHNQIFKTKILSDFPEETLKKLK